MIFCLPFGVLVCVSSHPQTPNPKPRILNPKPLTRCGKVFPVEDAFRFYNPQDFKLDPSDNHRLNLKNASFDMATYTRYASDFLSQGVTGDYSYIKNLAYDAGGHNEAPVHTFVALVPKKVIHNLAICGTNMHPLMMFVGTNMHPLMVFVGTNMHPCMDQALLIATRQRLQI